MLEELEPTVQGPIQPLDDVFQRGAAGPWRLRPNVVFQLVQTRPPRPGHAPLEVITQEVESAFHAGVHQSRLGRMEAYSTSPDPLPHLLHPTLRFRLAATVHATIF